MAMDGIEPLSDCRGFRWVGQPWEHCDECGRPWHVHDGLMTLRRDATPFGDDGWYIKPWSEIAKTADG